MKTYPSKEAGLAILLLLILLLSVASLTAQQSSDPGKERIPGWALWTGKLAQLDEHLLAQLPERLRADPQIRQEAGRLLIGAVAAQSIAALGADADHPEFLPSLNFYLEIGQPNADTTYRSAAVDGNGAYRIRGEIGSVRILRVGLFGPAVNGSWFSLPVPTYYDFKTLHVDAKGHFDVLLSQERPANYTGDWWKLEPNTQQLLLRQVASNWATERDPRISIERIDKPVERSRPSAEEFEKRLDTLADQIEHSALMLVNHVETLRKQGFINKLTVFDASHMGGLVGQSYYEGAYDLKPSAHPTLFRASARSTSLGFALLCHPTRPPLRCRIARRIFVIGALNFSNGHSGKSLLRDEDKRTMKILSTVWPAALTALSVSGAFLQAETPAATQNPQSCQSESIVSEYAAAHAPARQSQLALSDRAQQRHTLFVSQSGSTLTVCYWRQDARTKAERR